MSLMNRYNTYFKLLENKRMMIVESTGFMIVSLDLFRHKLLKQCKSTSYSLLKCLRNQISED